jgi:hypothetical protein
VVAGQRQLTSANIMDGRQRRVYFYNDISGQAVRRDEYDTNYSAGDMVHVTPLRYVRCTLRGAKRRYLL